MPESWCYPSAKLGKSMKQANYGESVIAMLLCFKGIRGILQKVDREVLKDVLLNRRCAGVKVHSQSKIVENTLAKVLCVWPVDAVQSEK